MSDTSFAAVSQNSKLIEAIDDEWLQDALSDDEIEIPKDFDINTEEDEEEEESLVKADDAWNDLGLENFLVEPPTAPPVRD
ncbi:hypothetical protein B484DRAFT_395683 [Ochromonadaceae sp. CCMP2298]|nr:hypothetical protein B484DRAFT_395683 [Ochromonadaceae sp. CCMP2298]|mmetsp:Transcript_15034/g.33162  ORF Transcript_15034/g.33162 Transcript_15034/m.33162 type:complete len:81 (+) Transcript_15034:85-327(+)